MDYFEFRRTFEANLKSLKLASDCTLQEPSWEEYAPPLFWSVEAMFQFTDGKHIRIREYYSKFAGLQMSRKTSWSYHYGSTQATDADGYAVRGNPDDPLEIRIDTCSGLHLHYQKREPHFEQNRVVGLDLNDMNWLKFVKGVLRHRQSGLPFTKIFGFKLK